MAFEINGSAPTPDAAKPSYYNESGVIHFPDSGQSIRGDGHSITTGKPWLDLKWPTISAAGAAYWYDLFSADTTPSVAATSVQAYNPRSESYTTYSTTGIIHRPTYGSIEFRSTAPIFKNFRVLITELS